MFLYDKKGNYIDVYKLEPNLEKIKKYRKKEMAKIPDDMKCWVAKSNNVDHKPLERCGTSIDYSKLDISIFSFGYTVNHNFESSSIKIPQNERFLQQYYEDEEFIYRLCKIRKDVETMYVLFLENEYLRGDYIGDYPYYRYYMRGIINMPETLYLLEALLKGRTDLIGNKDINKQLSLFDIEYVDRIDVNVIKNICDYKLVIGNPDHIMDMIDSHKEVVGKVRSLVKK